MSLAAWLATGCDIGPDKPASKPVHRPKVAKRAPTTATPKSSKHLKLPKEAVPGTAEYLDEKNGFRDVTFGQSDADFSNLIFKEKDEKQQLATYTRTGDVLSLETVPLETIEYTFFKGQLSQIMLKWQVQHQESVLAIPPSTEMAVTLSTIYARPKRRAAQKDCTKYSWAGKKVEIMMHEFRMPGVAAPAKTGWTIPPTTSGQMIIQSIPLRHELESFLASQAHGGL
ncbi:MAG: hypothetical protein NTZ16_14210 [Verrucomicrobia bacterium]|nr:hypothetical protein [Verrucomicrobiota bacterium]